MGTAWFVDGGYASKAWQSVAGTSRMDYALLRAMIEKDAGEAIGDAYYFNCDNDPASAGQNAVPSLLELAASSWRGPTGQAVLAANEGA